MGQVDGDGAARRAPGSDRRRRLGVAGEDLAASWYEAAGYRVLDRNWRCSDGEIDLVVRRGETVVVVEVKARTSAAFGSAASAVTAAKQRRLRRLAVRWLAEHRPRCGAVRFDVVAVTAGHLEVLVGAF